MKNILHATILLMLCLFYSVSSAAQDSLDFDLEYNVKRIYPGIFIPECNIAAANTLIDLNKNYKADWVKKYISVEITTTNNGTTNKALSKNNILTDEQKNILTSADLGSDIWVLVKYVPDNNLKSNSNQELRFSFKVDPDEDATFIGGHQQLSEYLETYTNNYINKDIFKKNYLTAVNFTIDEKGQVIDAHIPEKLNDEQTNKMLLETICEMPNWKPAKYANGTAAKQDFALLVGDMRSCMINMYKVRQF